MESFANIKFVLAGEVLELRNAGREGMETGRCVKGKDTDMSWIEVRRELSRPGASYYYRQGLFPILLAKAGVSPGMHEVQRPTSVFANNLPRLIPPPDPFCSLRVAC